MKERIHQSNSRIVCSSFVGSKSEEVIQEVLLTKPSEQKASQLIHWGKITQDSSPLSDELRSVIIEDLKDKLGYEERPFMTFQNPEESSSDIHFFWVKFDWNGELVHKDLNPQKVVCALQVIRERYKTPQLIISNEPGNE
jgi:hypothetical protein